MRKIPSRAEQKIINELLAKTPVRVQKMVRPLLRKRDWFSKVGTPHPRDFALTRVGSWKQANTSTMWTSLQRPISIVFKAPTEAASNRQHNRVWDVIDRAIVQAFQRNFGMWSTAIQAPYMNYAYGILGERIGFLAAAIAFNDAQAIRFCTEMIGYYADGYFPCGWDGKYPHGRWIVF